MLDKLANALEFQQQALALREQRQRVLANNIANADTPQFKAQDFNFQQALQRATQQQIAPVAVTRTHAGHQQLTSAPATAASLSYRVPTQERLDGNTVDMDRERAAFLDNTLRYQADIQFMDDKVSGLRKAMQPEQ
ncbi:flagellar basal body rod protein FlgB [Pseudidiomarina insulisalsae]|uniref:Flagellar basal body rod protein FlgB n=1 Tax=Pseudidiomarina insulisalsae TaxID=575789 RepID=A0A432YDJ2_9GAMM|nr:flagellar basal body rod protein FlgB [Pseudidiomarina insulisalsae]RUO59034.1 flagellar basal body rod protein FlgB [Pseudidiomarina insulisalsae]